MLLERERTVNFARERNQHDGPIAGRGLIFLLPQARSRIMASIRGRDTRPELFVRRALWMEGFRYRLHSRRLPGRPDLALAKYSVAIFVNGCFWHQHSCLQSRRPSSNSEYWERKLDANVARDSQNQSKLRELGWTVAIVWECRLQQDTEAVLSLLEGLRRNSLDGLP